MKTSEKTSIKIETVINAPIEQVWEFWTEPRHILKWNQASDQWHTTYAENALTVGGRFLFRMEAKDGSAGFDFTGEYSEIQKQKKIIYTMDDNRKVQVLFDSNGNKTVVTELFEAEQSNSMEAQRSGWQAILDNFKNYVESYGKMVSLHFEVRIAARVENVYKTMLDEKLYREWTSEFNPTSYYKGSWQKGSKIHFIGSDEEGNTGGMVAMIKENIPSKFVSIESIGVLKGDQEVTSGPEVEDWAGGLENYTFKQENENTLLLVDLDTTKEFKSYFMETYPKALEKLKAICEKNSN